MERAAWGSGTLLSDNADDRVGIAKGFSVVSFDENVILTTSNSTAAWSPTFIPGTCVNDAIDNYTLDFVLNTTRVIRGTKNASPNSNSDSYREERREPAMKNINWVQIQIEGE